MQNVPRFEQMLLQEGGIPHSLRPFLWPLLCGALEKRSKSKRNLLTDFIFSNKRPIRLC